MNSNLNPSSPTPVQSLFDSIAPTPLPTETPGELLFSLEIDGRLPSWNEILGMEHWARDKFKSQLQEDFLFALRQSAAGCLTKTICARSTLLTAAATLESYRETVRLRRKLRRDKKRQSRADASLFESKSSKGKVPF